MTDIQTYQPPTAPVLTDPTGGRLVAWAEAAGAAHELAAALCQTTFVPSVFAGKPGDATAAILMGDELGLSPIAALRSIYVVHGTPALYAKSMVALAQSHGHDIWTESTSPSEVVVCGQRKGSTHVERASWTIRRATQAKYTGNAKYASNPEEMLYSKAAAEIARKVAADVLAGVPYSVEDLELDVEPTTTKVGRDEAVKPARAKRSTAAPAPAEPEFDTPPTPPVEGEITDKTRGRMFALLGELGINDENEQRAGMSKVLGRTVESRATVTEEEAQRVIRSLEARIPPPPADDRAEADDAALLDDPTTQPGWNDRG